MSEACFLQKPLFLSTFAKWTPSPGVLEWPSSGVSPCRSYSLLIRTPDILDSVTSLTVIISLKSLCLNVGTWWAKASTYEFEGNIVQSITKS